MIKMFMMLEQLQSSCTVFYSKRFLVWDRFMVIALFGHLSDNKIM